MRRRSALRSFRGWLGISRRASRPCDRRDIVMRMRFGRSILLGLALLGLTGAVVGAPSAYADQLPAPTVSTWSAPDGVFVDWDDVNPSGYYRVTRTVDGVSTTRVSWGSRYSDGALQPGQEATYVVEAYVSSTE